MIKIYFQFLILLTQDIYIHNGILLETVLARSYPRNVRGKNEGNAL